MDESLRKEKQRAHMLQKKTDELAARRAREFAIAVQSGMVNIGSLLAVHNRELSFERQWRQFGAVFR